MMETLQDEPAGDGAPTTEPDPATEPAPQDSNDGTADPGPEDEAPEGFAMDFTGTEGARLVESAKQMREPEPREDPEEPEAQREPRGGHRVEMGENLLQTTVDNGGAMLFDALSYGLGQDMTLTQSEKAELTRYATPVVKKRLPQKKKYLPEVLLGALIVNMIYDKFDVQKAV
jgi:hypothetical protein